VPASLSNQAIIASANLNEPHAALSSASPSPPQPQQLGINDASDASESISEVSTVSSASMEEEESWIASFCNVIGHEYFVEVSEDFIEDDFNLTGLGAIVPMYRYSGGPDQSKHSADDEELRYKEALEMILDVEPESSSESLGSASESLSENATSYRRPRGHQRSASDYSMIETSAELLYGLVHQRFITSRGGIQVMYEKYLLNHFGFCPRVNCNSARVLPCGYSDTPGTETVKLFCPSCCDIYVPPNSRFQTVDGAYFGTTFPTLFLMTFPELDISGNGKKEAIPSNSLNSVGGKKGGSGTLPPINGVPENNIAPGLGKGKRYEMRIYGFRVNERARSGPRMGWLRERPEDVRELDEMAKFEERDGYESDEEEMAEEDEEDEVMEDGGGGAVATLSPVRGRWPGDFQSRS
jgi:casein kinase II subunit beta